MEAASSFKFANLLDEFVMTAMVIQFINLLVGDWRQVTNAGMLRAQTNNIIYIKYYSLCERLLSNFSLIFQNSTKGFRRFLKIQRKAFVDF